MSNSFDKLSVLDSFIEEVNSYLPEIEANLGRLAHTPGDMEALEETYRRTHTIGGSASMMDFPGLAHVAHGMEDILGDVMDDMATLDSPTIGLLQRLNMDVLAGYSASRHSFFDEIVERAAGDVRGLSPHFLKKRPDPLGCTQLNLNRAVFSLNQRSRTNLAIETTADWTSGRCCVDPLRPPGLSLAI